MSKADIEVAVDTLTIAEVKALFALCMVDVPDKPAMRRWIAAAAHVGPPVCCGDGR